MKAGLFTILLLLCALSGISQPFSSAGGIFTVNQEKACDPFTVQLNAPSCDGVGNSCDVNFGDGVFRSVVLSQNFTYTAPGTYLIKFFRNAERDSLLIEIFENIPPEVQIVTCGGNRISVSTLDNRYDQYIINYNDGSPEVTIAGGSANQHAYAVAGAQTVTVRGKNLGAFDNCASTSANVTVMPQLPTPFISTAEVLSASDVRLAFNGQPNIFYRLEMSTNNGAFQPVRTLFNVTADTVRSIFPDNNIYCFRIGAFDPCSNLTTYSNTLCTTDLDLDILNNENRLTWRTTAGSSPITNQSIRITSENTGTTIFTSGTSPYSHTADLVCGTTYCYQTTVHHQDGSQSISQEKCGEAISTDIPTTIVNTSAVVNENGLTLITYPDPDFLAGEFSFYRSNGASFPLLLTSADPSAADPDWTVESGWCYKINYRDVCGNESELSAPVCPIVLTGSLTGANEAVLQWSAFTGWANGVERYLLDKIDVQGALIETIDAGPALDYTDASVDLENQVYIYRVRAIPVDPLEVSVSNAVTIVRNPNLFYPAAFTPNGDGLNDIFNVFGQYIAGFEMDIFNRWGELVFTTVDLEQGWDGSFKGSAMPEGTYTFVANITDLAGRRFKRSGSILLLKKSK